MKDSPTSPRSPSRFDPLVQPFRLLSTDPAATDVQIRAAFAVALEQRKASEKALAEARAAILEPALRLSCELTYPIDSTLAQIETFYAEVSHNTSKYELLQVADGLAPLSRANFIAHLAAQGPADSALLLALVDAHACVDATELYTVLKALRNRAGWPTPSLVGVNEGLNGLLTLHAEVAIAGYDTIQSAARPILECTQGVLVACEPYRVEALSGLLDAYRRSTAEIRSEADQRFERACGALGQRPNDTSAIDEFSSALWLWINLSQPLILLETHQGRQDRDLENAIGHVRLLLANLSVLHRETARKIVDLARDAFGLVPSAVVQFNEASDLLRNMSLESAIKPLRDLIERLDSDPSPLVKAVEKDGFGKQSSQPARDLWQAFCRTLEATNSTKFSQHPWMLTRDLAVHLGNHSETATAASRLIAGLIRHAESTSADPAILDTLRDDLSYIERAHHTAAPTKSVVSKQYGKRALLAGLVLVGIFCAFIAYRYYDTASPPFFTRPPESSLEASTPSEPETVPPVGKGQRFPLHYVRYCHFQEERLRIIQQEVRGLEDVRAYNLLANDYNSRCSNFLYLDRDLKIVMEEVNAKRKSLEVDAMRILASWPWHAASSTTSPTK